MKTLIYDINRDRLVDESGQTYQSPVNLAYQDYDVWRIYFATVEGTEITYLDLSTLGIVQMRGAVDYDYVHGVVNGALTAAASGAVTAIPADGFSKAPPAVGIFRITNAGGSYEDVAYSAYSGTWASASSVLTFAVDTTLANSYAENDVLSCEDTAPMVRITNDKIDWTHLADGYIDVTVDADTNTFAAALAGLPTKAAIFEIMGINSLDRKRLYAKFAIVCGNEVDPQGGTVSPGPASKYYDKTDIDALLVSSRPREITLTSEPTDTTTLASVDPTAAPGSWGWFGGRKYTWDRGAYPSITNPETAW